MLDLAFPAAGAGAVTGLLELFDFCDGISGGRRYLFVVQVRKVVHESLFRARVCNGGVLDGTAPVPQGVD